MLRPLAALADVPPIVDLSGRQRYVDVQRMFDANYPAGGHYYWTSQFLDGLTDAAIDAALDAAATSPSPLSTVAFWQLGGAVDRATAAASAYAHRGAAFLLGVDATFTPPDPDERAANIAWARRRRRRRSRGRYVNLPGFLEDPHAADVSGAAVEAVRRRYDPDGLFAGLGARS